MNPHVQKESSLHDESDERLEFEEINAKINPEYDLNYTPLTKWTKYHLKTQII